MKPSPPNWITFELAASDTEQETLSKEEIESIIALVKEAIITADFDNEVTYADSHRAAQINSAKRTLH